MPSKEVNETINNLVELAECNRDVQDALLQIVFNAYEHIAAEKRRLGDTTPDIYDVYEDKADLLCSKGYREQLIFILSTMTTEELFEELDIGELNND